jgi:hypothetical protein
MPEYGYSGFKSFPTRNAVIRVSVGNGLKPFPTTERSNLVMRFKPLSLVLILLLLAASHLTAMAESEGQYCIMLQPLALVSNDISPEIEFPLGSHFGLGIRANAVVNWEIKGGKSNSSDDWDWIYRYNGGGLGLSGRFYPGGRGPKGFYLGPRLDYVSCQGTYEDRVHNKAAVDTTLTITIAHLELGYKWLIKDTIVLGLFGDGGYGAVKSDGEASLASLFALIGGGVYVGWAF